MSVRVIANNDNGTETDVTEGVQALYDFCVQSMDWGSGFLSVEDAEGIIKIAQACGFLMPEGAAAAFESYVKDIAPKYFPPSDYRPGGWSYSSSNVICAVCGEQVGYSFVESKWIHIAHDPGHPPQLWR